MLLWEEYGPGNFGIFTTMLDVLYDYATLSNTGVWKQVQRKVFANIDIKAEEAEIVRSLYLHGATIPEFAGLRISNLP